MNKIFYYIVCILGALGISIGALGAHLLKNYLMVHNKTAIFETAVKYHIYHTLFALLILFFNKEGNKYLNKALIFSIIGIVLFSFTLYTNCILPMFGLKIKWINLLTPIGGLFFVLSWIIIIPYSINKK